MNAVQVIRDDGQPGTVVQRIAAPEGGPQLVVAFADGSRVVVPEDVLVRQPDGTYRLRLTHATPVNQVVTGAATEESIVVPVVAETLTVEKRQVARSTVRVRTRVETREEVVDEPLWREEVVIERVPVGTLVDGEVPTPHDEGGVVVIPILEEVLVVQKRVFHTENVRVSTRRTAIHRPQQVTLRREVVEVERVAPDAPPGSPPGVTGA
jgi:uncharacterized protein (TIGR02271 family)